MTTKAAVPSTPETVSVVFFTPVSVSTASAPLTYNPIFPSQPISPCVLLEKMTLLQNSNISLMIYKWKFVSVIRNLVKAKNKEIVIFLQRKTSLYAIVFSLNLGLMFVLSLG